MIAVDGSPAARRATEVGLSFAAEITARVLFVHGSPKLAKRLLVESPTEKPSDEHRLVIDPVLKEAAELAREKGVEATFDIYGAEGSGSLAPAIAGLAEGENAIMIVLGSRGHGPVTSLVLGSVSLGVLNSTNIPVLVVHASHSNN